MLYIECANSLMSERVQRFVYESSLSQCYTLKVQLHLNLPLEFQQIVFKNAHLSYQDPHQERHWIHGCVTHLESEYDANQQLYLTTITIRPSLYLLHYSRQFRVFNQCALLDQARLVVNNLLRQRKLPSHYANFNVTDALLTTDFNRATVQYADHDLAFFEQTIQMGARYYFTQGEEIEQLIVIDTPQALPDRNQIIQYQPDKKEAITQTETPVFYTFNLQQNQRRQAKPVYFDPFNPHSSRNYLHKNVQAEQGMTSIVCYAPTDQYHLIAQRLTDQLNAQEKYYDFGTYYSNLLIGECLQIATEQDSASVFIESLTMHAEQSNDIWRFEISGIARPYDAQGPWLGPYQEPAKMPGFLRGAMIPELAQINDFGQHQVQFPLDLTAGNEAPAVFLRELQETSTQRGGATHSVSGQAEALLVSQDGLHTDWLIAGSLTNEGRETTVTPNNYQQSRIATNSGLNMHLTRQDDSNPYGQLGIHLADSDANNASVNLGTNQNLLDASPSAHGIQESSSGYAKRIASGNHYQTIGSVDYPIRQSRLTQAGGLTQHSTQMNIGHGCYTQIYQSDPAGVKTVTPTQSS
jgi:hypothetical protein